MVKEAKDVFVLYLFVFAHFQIYEYIFKFKILLGSKDVSIVIY